MSAVSDALAEEPRGRIAGIFLLSDGRVHDSGTHTRSARADAPAA